MNHYSGTDLSLTSGYLWGEPLFRDIPSKSYLGSESSIREISKSAIVSEINIDVEFLEKDSFTDLDESQVFHSLPPPHHCMITPPSHCQH